MLAAFAHQEPDRVPVWCGASPGFIAKALRRLELKNPEDLLLRFGDDFRRVSARYAGPVERSPDSGLPAGVSCRTPFAVEHRGYGCGIPVNPPLADASLKQVHDFAWPDPNWIDVSQVRSDAMRWNRQFAILGGDWSPFWHDANELLGMENLMLKMHDQPDLVDAVFEHVVDYYFEVSRRIFETAADSIDIFFIGNDFGSRMGPLISEAMFRRFVFPHLQRLARLGHDFGLKVMMHCCGGFVPLIPAMIEAGLDGLQALQPSTRGMDPAALKAAFGHKLVLNGCVDSHHTLIKGTPESARDTTRKLLQIMKPGGGFVLSASHDWILEETPVENVLAMFDAARDFGMYA